MNEMNYDHMDDMNNTDMDNESRSCNSMRCELNQEGVMPGAPNRQCCDKDGMLSACAPLANPFVPFQQSGSARYEARRGLVRGTLFPGLDLPFMGMVNKHEKSDTPMHQMQALHFAINELVLYLDTHPEDTEALELLRQYNEMYHHGQEEMMRLHGPQTVLQAGQGESFDWVKNPWPWELAANEED